MVVIIQSQIYNNILRLSEFRHHVGQKNLTFIYSFAEFFQDPFISFFGNTRALSEWLLLYITVPIFVFIVISIIWLFYVDRRHALFFLGYFLVPFISLAFFGKVIYPRFVLFMIPPLLIPAGMFATRLWEFLSSYPRVKTAYVGMIVVMFIPAWYFIFMLVTQPIKAPLPNTDRQQFINDWPAGYGISEVIDYLANKSQAEKIIIATEGTFGLFPMALELYLGENKNITFKPLWPVNEVSEELKILAREYSTYLIFKERQSIPQEWPLMLIREYQRGDGPTYLRIYQVKP